MGRIALSSGVVVDFNLVFPQGCGSPDNVGVHAIGKSFHFELKHVSSHSKITNDRLIIYESIQVVNHSGVVGSRPKSLIPAYVC
jgi:hypothetical protein